MLSYAHARPGRHSLWHALRVGRVPLRGRPWGPDDLTGGPVDDVFAGLRARAPGLVIERIEVTHAGDDDNLFFVGDERGFERVEAG